MKKTIIVKIIYQVIIGAALSFLYMQFRPYEKFTLSWPFAFLGSWFLLMGWFAYLKADNLSITKIFDEEKKNAQRTSTSSKFKIPSFIDYINTPIQPDVSFTEKEKSIIKIVSDMFTSAIFFFLTVFF